MKDLSLEELLEMLKSGKVGNINSYYMGMFIRCLEELKRFRDTFSLIYEEDEEGNPALTYSELSYKLDKMEEELMEYKKALKLLCEYLDDSGICVGCGKNCPPDGSKTPCSNVIYETYLLEAREQK